MKLTKCTFYQKQIHYLGHIIIADGVSVDPSKIRAILEWPVPQNVSEIRSFMGLAGYYQKFVEGFFKNCSTYHLTKLEREEICVDL